MNKLLSCFGVDKNNKKGGFNFDQKQKIRHSLLKQPSSEEQMFELQIESLDTAVEISVLKTKYQRLEEVHEYHRKHSLKLQQQIFDLQTKLEKLGIGEKYLSQGCLIIGHHKSYKSLTRLDSSGYGSD